MPDERLISGEPERSGVSTADRHEVEELASRYGLTTDEVRALIVRFGSDRTALEREAMKRAQR